MRRAKYKILGFAAAVSLAASGGASAVTFEGTAVGSWLVPAGTFGVAIDNSDSGGLASLEWGIPGGGFSSNLFTFDGVGSDGGGETWTAADETAFRIGDFTYRNGSVFPTSHNFTDGDLSILLTLISPTGLANTFSFHFDVVSTDNVHNDPVLDADIVTIPTILPPTSFFFDGVDYTLAVLGFSSDGGATIREEFRSPEETTAEASVYAKITRATAPEPTTLALLGIGLAGLALRGRRT